MILHLNPDIFHTINKIMHDAYRYKKGEAVDCSAIEKNELEKLAEGKSEIPFMPDFEGGRA